MSDLRAARSRGTDGKSGNLTLETGRQDRDQRTTAAMGENGTAVLAWGVDPVEARVSERGGSWDSSTSIGDGAHPDAAVTADGTIYVAVGAARIGRGVQVARRPPGGDWAIEQVPSGINGHDPHIAAVGDSAIVVWRSLDEPRRVLSSVRSGGVWQPAQVVPVETNDFPPVPSLALDHRGGAIAIWRETQAGADSRIMVSRRSAHGDWGTPLRLDAGQPVGQPQVAFDAAGNAMATWLGRGTSRSRASVRAARFDSFSRSWGSPVELGQTTAAQPPDLAVGRTGQAVVAWIDRSGARAARGSSLTGRFDPPETIGGPTRGALVSGIQDIGVSQDGLALVVWQETRRNSSKALRVSVRKAGAGERVRPTAAQLLINQRISQAALRRSNSALTALQAGLPSAALADGGLDVSSFGSSVVIAGSPNGQEASPGDRYRVPIADSDTRSAQVTLSAAQLKINQRIAQAAVRRANALIGRLADGLIGRDLSEGAITALKLAQGLTVASSGPAPPLGPAIEVAPPRGRGGRVRFDPAQLRINQRISQAAVRRSNFAIAVLESGLSTADFAPGSLTARELAPELH